MTPSRLALIAVLPTLALLACGEPGPSEEMRESDGEANAPRVYIPDDQVENRYTGFGDDASGEIADGAEVGDALPPGGDGDDEEDYEPRAEPQDANTPPGGEAEGDAAGATAPQAEEEASSEDPLGRHVASSEREASDTARDEDRHPAETLAFFGIRPDMTVVEVWPGGGYYTSILAPYLAEGGSYYAAGPDPAQGQYQARAVARFEEQFVGREGYGDVQVTTLGPDVETVAPEGSADMVLTFRNVHNWMMGDYAEDAFEAFYASLKPGGVLGVVEHRLPEEADDALMESSGYVKESVVVEMAEAAGFELADRSEVNANPDDTADHPFGVWTLPPTSRTTDRDGNAPEGFDAERYAAIGESDRMTLRFVKPLGADGALFE